MTPAALEGVWLAGEDESPLPPASADWYEAADRPAAARRPLSVWTPTGCALLDNKALPSYDRLLIATGAVHATLDIPGADLPGVYPALARRDARRSSGDMTAGGPVVGRGWLHRRGGRLGLPPRGLNVTVIEPLAVPMARAWARKLRNLFVGSASCAWCDLRLGEGVTAIRGTRRVEEEWSRRRARASWQRR
jgi:NADPH-dependent 2,4-dienoyl-CoA reductase/sulfur reductase-like enzyme